MADLNGHSDLIHDDSDVSGGAPSDGNAEEHSEHDQVHPGDPEQGGLQNGRIDQRAMSANQIRTLQREELVISLIREAKAIGAITIDLSHKSLSQIPPELLECQYIEYLYLEGNELTSLPENFFDCLPRLKWLDLRQNYLASIPTTYIGRHQCLRNLLLEGNELRTLPLELGLVTTLNGLNISNNPLEFPPPEVLERGTQTVLAFLRELLKAKSIGKIPPVPRIEDLRLRDSGGDSDSEEEWGAKSHLNSRKNSHTKSFVDVNRRGSTSKDSRSTFDEFEDLVGPVPQSVSLHKPTSYDEIKRHKKERLMQAGALGSPPQMRREKSLTSNFRRNNSVPAQDKIQEKFVEERRLARLKEMKEKQEMILQRRRDQEALKDFRDKGRHLQRNKQMDKIKGKLEYKEPAAEAPFGVDQEHMKIPSNEERIAQAVKAKHEKIRRVMTPNTRQKLEDQRQMRDKELEKRIKTHTTSMQDRRKQPKGTPQEEMQAAKQELQMAEQLQREIEKRKKDLEYRFTAFTGDVLEKRIKTHTTSMQDRRKQPKGTPQEEMQAAKQELQMAEQLQREIEKRKKDLEYRFTAFTGDVVGYSSKSHPVKY